MNVKVCFAASALLLASCFVAPAVARADSFGFTLSSTSLNGSGTLTTVADASGSGLQDITGISGTVNGVAIAGTVASNFTPTTVTFPDTFYFTFDNLLNTSNPTDPFDGYGLGFETSDGVYYNIGTDPAKGLVYQAFNGVLQFDQQTYNEPSVAITLTPTSVTPEPSSIALMGTGLLMAAGMLRRRVVRS